MSKFLFALVIMACLLAVGCTKTNEKQTATNPPAYTAIDFNGVTYVLTGTVVNKNEVGEFLGYPPKDSIRRINCDIECQPPDFFNNDMLYKYKDNENSIMVFIQARNEYYELKRYNR